VERFDVTAEVEDKDVLDTLEEAVKERRKRIKIAEKKKEEKLKIARNIVQLINNSPKIKHSEYMKYLEYKEYDTNVKLWDNKFFKKLRKDPMLNMVYERLD
jgi:hypothetical protein